MAKEGVEQLNKDLASDLQNIANREQATIISFVAPDDSIRVSPAQLAYASITEKEMYDLEQIIKEAQSIPNALNRLHLIIHTPGGDLHTSYKIAYYLRSKFAEIKSFVPYQAASGGTLLCCAANSIYLGELGNLTPIDPQVVYKDIGRISAFAFERSVDYIKNLFGELSPAEVPTPFQQMADKFDPIIFDQMFTLVRNTYWYARNLLVKSGYNKEDDGSDKELDLAGNIAYQLARTQNVHSHVILSDEAKSIGLKIQVDETLMSVYRRLVSDRLSQRTSHHCINRFFPQQQTSNLFTSNQTPYDAASSADTASSGQRQ